MGLKGQHPVVAPPVTTPLPPMAFGYKFLVVASCFIPSLGDCEVESFREASLAKYQYYDYLSPRYAAWACCRATLYCIMAMGSVDCQICQAHDEGFCDYSAQFVARHLSGSSHAGLLQAEPFRYKPQQGSQ